MRLPFIILLIIFYITFTYYNKQKCTSGECGVINWLYISDKQKSDPKISFDYKQLVDANNLYSVYQTYP